jgi:hypothetical protein
MQQNEEENVVEEELQFANVVTQFHTLEIVQYIMSITPETEERHVGYKTLFITVMEPWETFSGRAMRQPNV